MSEGLRPAPGQPGSNQLPFMAAFGDPDLIDCGCALLPFRSREKHSRECLAWRTQWQRERELANALLPEDILWLNSHGWDGGFA